MEKSYYSRSFIKDNKFIIEEITAFIHNIKALNGDAIVTHAGGNGRFGFILKGIQYFTEFEKNICKANNSDEYYEYSNVNFNIDINKNWIHLYLNNVDMENYWKEIFNN